MKKVLLYVLVLTLSLTLAACGRDNEDKKTSSDTSNTEQSAVVDSENKATNESSTASGSAWSDGQQLPDMPIE